MVRSDRDISANTARSRFWQRAVSATSGPQRSARWLLERLRRRSPHGLWLLSAASLVMLVVWTVLDPRFDAAASGLLTGGRSIEAGAADGWPIQLRVFLLSALLVLVTLTFALMFLTLFVGSRRQRALSAWLVFITLFGSWAAMATNWPRVTWWGKQYRLQSQVGEFETVAQELRTHWPRDDGELASHDPYMAYPVGNPSTLIMLTLPKTTRAGTSFSVVERGKSGALRFQLTGREAGDWLEWHPVNERPTSFVGGLVDPHLLQQYWELGEGWFLVRYRQ